MIHETAGQANSDHGKPTLLVMEYYGTLIVVVQQLRGSKRQQPQRRQATHAAMPLTVDLLTGDCRPREPSMRRPRTLTPAFPFRAARHWTLRYPALTGSHGHAS